MHGTLSAMDERTIPAVAAPARPRRLLERRPARLTLVAIAIGLVGVLVSETAASRAPVALPMLFATGLLGAMVRPGWGGPGATWLGGAIAECGTAIVYLLTRPADVAWQDDLVPIYFFAGIMLFAGIFFAAFVTAEAVRRLLAPRTAELVLRLGIAAILGVSLFVLLTAP